MELLACRMYLSIKECIQFDGFETSNYDGGVRDSLSSNTPHPTPLLCWGYMISRPCALRFEGAKSSALKACLF